MHGYHESLNFTVSDHHNHCDDKPEDTRKCHFSKAISKLDSQDTEDGQETTSESVSDKKKVPSFPSPKTDVVKRVRPKMVRQAPIDLDSDSSESRHQAISTEVGSLKIGSPMQNQLNNDRAI